jgi:hypothetical protein
MTESPNVNLRNVDIKEIFGELRRRNLSVGDIAEAANVTSWRTPRRDPATLLRLYALMMGALLGHRLGQDGEREAWGPAYVDHGLVFAREDGEPLHPESVTKRFGRLAAAAGLRPIRLHDLRHGQASLMLAAGVPLAVVSKRLGHSSVAITSDTYSHLLEGVGREAAERAAALVPRRRREQFVSTGDPGDKSAGPRFQEPAGERGAPPGTRTPNPRIKRPKFTQSEDDYQRPWPALEAPNRHHRQDSTPLAGQLYGQQIHSGHSPSRPAGHSAQTATSRLKLQHREQ